jgi:hypothetical protein
MAEFSKWSLTTLLRNWREPESPVTVREHRILNPYHSVSITAGTAACAAARECAGRRWLSADAPKLPLEGCRASECTCRFRHHDDRRIGSRRAEDQGRMAPSWSGPDRRNHRHDRRQY